MIRIDDKSNCCGCSACVHICPKQCIRLKQDDEGFLYPEVTSDVCIDCGLCERVCPFLNPASMHEPLEVYACLNRNEKERLASSSGGAFTKLAAIILSEGGVVFGACFDSDWNVIIDYTETLEGLSRFRSSKYVQASVLNSYDKVRTFLVEGRKVLFSGTPCQIAGLKHFLRKEYDNLLAIDVVCHGVPSPLVWNKYLDEVVPEGRQYIDEINFRNKDNGWTNFNFLLKANKQDLPRIKESFQENTYMKSFLFNLALRPSCHHCRAKAGRSQSDMTLADFWGIKKVKPSLFDDKGTGLVLVHTNKALDILNRGDLNLDRVSYSEGCQENFPIYCSVVADPRRNLFFSLLQSTNSICDLIERCTKLSWKQRIRKMLSQIKRTIIKY